MTGAPSSSSAGGGKCRSPAWPAWENRSFSDARGETFVRSCTLLPKSRREDRRLPVRRWERASVLCSSRLSFAPPHIFAAQSTVSPHRRARWLHRTSCSRMEEKLRPSTTRYRPLRLQARSRPPRSARRPLRLDQQTVVPIAPRSPKSPTSRLRTRRTTWRTVRLPWAPDSARTMPRTAMPARA